MLCRNCYNKIKDVDFYCRVCGKRTNKEPLPGETLKTPHIEEIKEVKKEKNPYKIFYIFAFITLIFFLGIIIYLLYLLIRSKI